MKRDPNSIEIQTLPDPVFVSPGSDNDICLTQQTASLHLGDIIFFCVEDAEKVAAAILAVARIVRGGK